MLVSDTDFQGLGVFHIFDYNWSMKENNQYGTGRHCVFELHAHLVFVTKYRGVVFTDEHLRSLESIFRSVRSDFEGMLEEFNGEADHVHLLVNLPPNVSVSNLVNGLTGVSSRRFKEPLYTSPVV